MISEAVTAVLLQTWDFWEVTPCSHWHGVTSQKTTNHEIPHYTALSMLCHFSSAPSDCVSSSAEQTIVVLRIWVCFKSTPQQSNICSHLETDQSSPQQPKPCPTLSQISPVHNCPTNVPALSQISPVHPVHNSPKYDPNLSQISPVHNSPIHVPILNQISPVHKRPKHVPMLSQISPVHNRSIHVPALSQICPVHNIPTHVSILSQISTVHNSPTHVPVLSQISSDHNSPTHVPVLNQISSDHNSPTHVPFWARSVQTTTDQHMSPFEPDLQSTPSNPVLCKIHFDVIIVSVPISSKLSLSLGFPSKSLNVFLSYPILATWLTNFFFLDFITWTVSGEQYESWISSSCICSLSLLLYPSEA